MAFGCSHTQGDESQSNYNVGINRESNIYYSYPYFISKELNITKYNNYASVGASNLQISQSVIEALQTTNNIPQKTLVIIGWTEFNRIPVITSSSKSLISLQQIYSKLPSIIKIHTYKLLRKNILTSQPLTITISQAIIKLIYARIIKNNSAYNDENKLINNHYYETKIAPYFHDEFLLGIEKHIFNTESNIYANNAYISFTENFLLQRKYNYIMVPMSYSIDNQFLVRKDKLFTVTEWPKNKKLYYIYGVKYGLAESGAHMTWRAHYRLANDIINKMLVTDDIE